MSVYVLLISLTSLLLTQLIISCAAWDGDKIIKHWFDNGSPLVPSSHETNSQPM